MLGLFERVTSKTNTDNTKAIFFNPVIMCNYIHNEKRDLIGTIHIMKTRHKL